MRLILKTFLLVFIVFAGTLTVWAGQCGECSRKKPNCPMKPCDRCCGRNGGILYCDSSAGRYVCKNGTYSTCYCSRHAVMDFQHLQGCCLWHGGVFQLDSATGLTICNDGSVSEVCSIESPPEPVASW